MGYTIKPAITNTVAAPISESNSWLPTEQTNRDAILLSQAVPNYPPAKDLQNHVAQLAGLSNISLYTEILGLPALRQALADHLGSDYCGNVIVEDVAITAGGNQAFSLALMAMAGEGDNVILPVPSFFNHEMWLDMNGIEIRCLICDPSDGMLPSPDDARKLIDERTRAVVLVTPNNPTGAIYPPQLIEAFYDLCADHGIALVIDETYKDFRDATEPAHGLFSRSDWRETFVHLYSFSKSFSLTGYRVGGLAASPRLVAEIEKLMDCVAICAPHIAQEAALFALRHLDEWRTQKAVEMAGKLSAIRDAFDTPELGYDITSSGAFFAYIRHPFDEPAKSVAQRLARNQSLLLLPGSMFGDGQEQFLRLAFANAELRQIPEIVARLIESQAASIAAD